MYSQKDLVKLHSQVSTNYFQKHNYTILSRIMNILQRSTALDAAIQLSP